MATVLATSGPARGDDVIGLTGMVAAVVDSIPSGSI
jgi:hypothetical protein